MNENYKQWIEDFLQIVDKNGELINFVPNAIQEDFLTKSITGKDIILKARQQGFSTLILAIFTCDFLMKPNTYNVVVSDIEENSEDLMARVKLYIESWAIKTGIPVKDVLKYNSKGFIENKINNSKYRIGSAKNVEFGRSKTITNLHLSEAAFYPHLERLLTGALQAVVPSGRVTIETTANGFNYFKEFWDRSELGETTFKAHFYKASDFYSDEFLNAKKKELGRMYVQEYPETALEAFITSGDLYFSDNDGSRTALEYYLQNVSEPIEKQL